MNKLIHALLFLLKTVAVFCLWALLAAFITLGISRLQKEHYASTDTPNAKFRINGQRLQDIKGDTQLQTEPTPIENCMDSCLKILENGNYLYINEGALQTTYSEYQLKDNAVIPISFKEDNFGHFLVGMVLAFLILSLLKYLYAIYQIRKDKTAFIIYHKKLARQLLIFVAIVVPVWGLMWWVGQ